MHEFINRNLRKLGIQIKRYPERSLRRRWQIMQGFAIDTLFDVGANEGQYGKEMRALGYRGALISFEPLQTAFARLQEQANKDQNWITNPYALGAKEETSIIHVAGNSYSSSMLNMLPQHQESAPDSAYINEQEIEIKTLNAVFDTFVDDAAKVMVKIDTQGYEKNVLEGATQVLSRITILQLEMSLVPLYEDEMLFVDMMQYLADRGFQLFSLEDGFADPHTGQLLQVDGIFVNKALMN